jgi:hypothetical protein
MGNQEQYIKYRKRRQELLDIGDLSGEDATQQAFEEIYKGGKAK